MSDKLDIKKVIKLGRLLRKEMVDKGAVRARSTVPNLICGVWRGGGGCGWGVQDV